MVDSRVLLTRDDERCAHCGTNYQLTPQHRRGRGMGGSKRKYTYAGYIVLCWESNVLLESDAAFAQEGRDKGWKINRSDPRQDSDIPVLYPDGWRWLTDDGNYRFTPVIEEVETL